MPWYEIIYFILALIIMLIGLVGTILPLIPGVPIIFGAIFIYALLTDFATINRDALLIFGILTLVTLFLDWVTTTLGVKKMGGSIIGMIGAFIGTIAGIAVSVMLGAMVLLGMIIGSFAGAFLFEIMIGKDADVALKAGLGSFIGFLAGGLIKVVIAIGMIAAFVWLAIF
nr:DUF456 domain-containing protein [candidate division Zixibacteria bacterium]